MNDTTDFEGRAFGGPRREGHVAADLHRIVQVEIVVTNLRSTLT